MEEREKWSVLLFKAWWWWMGLDYYKVEGDDIEEEENCLKKIWVINTRERDKYLRKGKKYKEKFSSSLVPRGCHEVDRRYLNFSLNSKLIKIFFLIQNKAKRIKL